MRRLGATLRRLWAMAPGWVRWHAGGRHWHGSRLRRAGTAAELGRAGESLAAAWLAAQGWRERTRNWHAGRVELDLVGCEDGVLVVVEVKTRTAAPDRPGGLWAVDRSKRAHLGRAVAAYLRAYPGGPRRWRGEVVEVTRHPDGRVTVARWKGPCWGRGDDRDRVR